MNEHFKRTLLTSRVYLVENIEYENLKDFLIEHGALPPAIIENIDSLPNRRQKIREMLDCLSRRGDNVFLTFLVSLFRSKQSHIAHNLYVTAINLIESSDFQLKGWLEENINTILSALPEHTQSNANHLQTLRQHNDDPVENSLPSPIQSLQTLKQHNVTVENSLPNPVQTLKQPVENSLPFYEKQEDPIPMESEESPTLFQESKLDTVSSNNNQATFPSSYKYPGNIDSSLNLKSQVEGSIPPSSSLKSQAEGSIPYASSSSLKSQAEGSIPPFSSLQPSHDNNSAYQMDSNPQGLFCIITPKGLQLTEDSVPVYNKCEKMKGEPTFTPKNTGNDTLKKCDTDLQVLFWDFGFECCLIELEDSTLHPDKLDNLVLQFSQLPTHKITDCCAMALLGFSADDLHLTKIFSWFNEQNCPSLAGKPKLFLIQVPNSKTTPSNVMSGVELPEDALVAVGKEDTDLQPGLVSSIVQVCQQMDKSSYSVQDIFSQVQLNYSESKIAVVKSLTKLWNVDSHCTLRKKKPIIT